jgi:DNA replication protein DnaC
MNNNQTLEKLKQMRLSAMAALHLQQLESTLYNDVTADEYLAILVDHQWEQRQQQQIDRLFKQAHFKQKASIAEVSFDQQRNLDKNMFNRLATMDFITKKENIIITGASGVGKSFLAQAFGNQACLNTKRVFYSNTARLFAKLKLTKLDGSYLKELKKIAKVDLLRLAAFGLQEFDKQAREALMDIIDDRHQNCSTIIASQIPVSLWYDIIGEGTIADAILDRIVNSSHRIELKGESLRKGTLKNN